MITSQELSRSLNGAMQLARGDRAGIAQFNATLEGFWNSVTAAVIVLPGHAFIIWLSYRAVPGDASDGRILLAEGIAYVIQWTALQLALFYYCQLIGRGDRFFAAAVSLNWADVPLMVVGVGITILILAGLPVGFGMFLLVALPLAYLLFVAKTALQSSIMAATGPVAIAFALGYLVRTVTSAITGQD